MLKRERVTTSLVLTLFLSFVKEDILCTEFSHVNPMPYHEDHLQIHVGQVPFLQKFRDRTP